ncbi:MAG TPA: Mur ligase family protein [Prolixibacteraceae bacterium]|nr:Mur ligase family protein [Prolixibacteraceae bacterium]
MHIHFIAIGGSAMHNLAIALKNKGFSVSGSDDEIFEPSLTRLKQHDLLPQHQGWYPENLHLGIDAVILGMHARADNPELLKAQQLGLKIYSYPEYLYEQTKNKTRVVIGGSHGKTTTTSMIMHVLKYHNVDFDYMVGANIEGFDTMVGLNNTSKLAVFEGDEYLSSPIDLNPKFLHYKPNIALITGIAWDHINVFPTFEGYVEQFRLFAQSIEPGGSLVWFGGDILLNNIAAQISAETKTYEYAALKSSLKGKQTIVETASGQVEVGVFGEHNLQNMAGAKKVCELVGIGSDKFFEAIQSFTGSSRRLELIAENEQTSIYYDFAHSPSKLKATTEAVKNQFPDRKLIAIMELHTFSSLKKDFLPQYNLCMSAADSAFVYFNPHTIEHKKLEMLNADEVKDAFGGGVDVFTNADQLFDLVEKINLKDVTLLIMTSGNFSGKDIKAIAKSLIE